MVALYMHLLIRRPNMKRNVVTILAALVVLLFSYSTAQAEAIPQTPELEAKNVLLVRLTEDLNTAQILYDKSSEELIYPASTLKMLTALTALDIVDTDEKAWVGLEQFLVPYDSSRAGLHIPMRLSVRDLLEGLLLPSGADAAYTLAAFCGKRLSGDKIESPSEEIQYFVDAMNRKAASLGAEHTTVINVDGYDAQGQMSTAQDILVIAQAFLKQPVLAEICAMPQAELDGGPGPAITVRNSNELLHEKSGYYNKDVNGIKTGTTSLAGSCLVSSFDVQGGKYICVLMNSNYDSRYADTWKLYKMCCSEFVPE